MGKLEDTDMVKNDHVVPSEEISESGAGNRDKQTSAEKSAVVTGDGVRTVRIIPKAEVVRLARQIMDENREVMETLAR